MTLKEWLEYLKRDYPYIDYAHVEGHSLHQGEFYGKHALEIRLVVTTGLVMEWDNTRHRDGKAKENAPSAPDFVSNRRFKRTKMEESKCGDTKEAKE